MGERLLTTVLASDFEDMVLIWDDAAANPEKPDPSSGIPWARVKIVHTAGRQGSIAAFGGKRRFVRSGFIIIQLFTNANTGLVPHDEIVTMILGAYEGKTTVGGLVFRNCRFQEIGDDGPWHQTNLFVDFEYDDVK